MSQAIALLELLRLELSVPLWMLAWLGRLKLPGERWRLLAPTVLAFGLAPLLSAAFLVSIRGASFYISSYPLHVALFAVVLVHAAEIVAARQIVWRAALIIAVLLAHIGTLLLIALWAS